MIEIILFLIIVTMFLLKPDSVQINLPNHNHEIFCDKFTGTWDGENCICKHPEFITNNYYNGNCDKIVDANCKKILNSELKSLNFNEQNPYTEGTCDCEKYYIYDLFHHKCVLRRLNMPQKQDQSTQICEKGYYFNKKYQTCLKELCSWDILNPVDKIDQKTISPNVCKCDFENGFVPVALSNETVGCTKSFTLIRKKTKPP